MEIIGFCTLRSEYKWLLTVKWIELGFKIGVPSMFSFLNIIPRY